MISPHAAETLSHDSNSTDEEPNLKDEGSVLTEILKLKEGSFRLYDIDSRAGLNGS
jgi:hypothetical protein